MLRDRFYDPDMHGVDWPAQREKALRPGGRHRPRRRLRRRHEHHAAQPQRLAHGLLSRRSRRPRRRGLAWALSFDPQHRGAGLAVAAVVPHGPADLADGRPRAGRRDPRRRRGRGGPRPELPRARRGGGRRPGVGPLQPGRRRVRGGAAPGHLAAHCASRSTRPTSRPTAPGWRSWATARSPTSTSRAWACPRSRSSSAISTPRPAARTP